jgi:hypothetical protein
VTDELIIRGSLEESSLPELLRSVTRSHETGVLTCTIHEYQKAIYILDGQIIFASSSNTDDRLGESLLRNDRVPLRPLMIASKMVRPGKRLGSILVDMNVLSPEELVEGVRNQVKDIIHSLFKVTKGQYELALKDVNTHEMILLNISTEDIIFDGVKSINSWTRILKGLGSIQHTMVPSAEASKLILNLTLEPEEQHLFSLCEKGQFKVEEICTMSYMSNFETCKHLWAFMMVGILDSIEPQEVKDQPTVMTANVISADMEYEFHDLVENYNDLFSHVYDYAFERVEDQAGTLAGKAMDQVKLSAPELLKNLTLDTYGRLDSDSLMRNISAIQGDGKMEVVAGALEEILYALLYEVGSYFGPEHQKKLTDEIQTLRKK